MVFSVDSSYYTCNVFVLLYVRSFIFCLQEYMRQEIKDGTHERKHVSCILPAMWFCLSRVSISRTVFSRMPAPLIIFKYGVAEFIFLP